jgi:hypothetical protein
MKVASRRSIKPLWGDERAKASTNLVATGQRLDLPFKWPSPELKWKYQPLSFG